MNVPENSRIDNAIRMSFGVDRPSFLSAFRPWWRVKHKNVAMQGFSVSSEFAVKGFVSSCEIYLFQESSDRPLHKGNWRPQEHLLFVSFGEAH